MYAPPSGPPPPTNASEHLSAPPSEQRCDNVPKRSDSHIAGEPPPPYTPSAAHAPPPVSADTKPYFVNLAVQPEPSPTLHLRRPLDPPPLAFSTPTPIRIRSRSFPPFRIPSVQSSLSSGFPLLYAPNELQSHGISSADWQRFLEDIGIAARLAAHGVSAISARGTPSSTVRPRFVTGPWGASRAIFGSRAGMTYDAAFHRTPVDEVKMLIDVWNQAAFERRKVRVSLHPRAEGRSRQGYDLLIEAL